LKNHKIIKQNAEKRGVSQNNVVKTASLEAFTRIQAIKCELSRLNYDAVQLKLCLIKLVFCIYVEQLGIFAHFPFRQIIENAKEDASDLHCILERFFNILPVPREKLASNSPFYDFPLISVGLFKLPQKFKALNPDFRFAVLDACDFEWQNIDPIFFGDIFQNIMDDLERRQDGVHYTSEENIFKVINSLFLDELKENYENVKNCSISLEAFHKKLHSIKLLDPACGCGNFLCVAYRELRRLENRVLARKLQIAAAKGHELQIRVKPSQCYGIELNPFACDLAQMTLWLVEQSMEQETQKLFLSKTANVKLNSTNNHESCAKIVSENAVKYDWQELLNNKVDCFDYILGNPPFVGARRMNDEQKRDLLRVFDGRKNAGNIDYICAWFYLAAKYMKNSPTQCAFVATNSICQGEQLATLWGAIFSLGLQLNFAYRSFLWKADCREHAAVYCVIIGFSHIAPSAPKIIYDGKERVLAKNISPYLVDAANVLVASRVEALSEVARMSFGSMANDDGGLLMDEVECKEFVNHTPELLRYIRPFVGAAEFIHNKKRYCLWLLGASDKVLKHPLILERLNKVRAHRARSKRKSTQKLSQTPQLFAEIRQPDHDYLLIPRVSSSERDYIPMGFVTKEVIVSDACLWLPKASVYDFGILTSSLHMTWMRLVAGRLASGYRYSINIVYNNFPWPNIDDAKKKNIAKLAQAVLEARNFFPNSSYASLYDPLTMPPALLKAHHQLDRAVLNAYGLKSNANEAAILKKLLELYSELLQKL
jgi:hypothetical protein